MTGRCRKHGRSRTRGGRLGGGGQAPGQANARATGDALFARGTLDDEGRRRRALAALAALGEGEERVFVAVVEMSGLHLHGQIRIVVVVVLVVVGTRGGLLPSLLWRYWWWGMGGMGDGEGAW